MTPATPPEMKQKSTEHCAQKNFRQRSQMGQYRQGGTGVPHPMTPPQAWPGPQLMVRRLGGGGQLGGPSSHAMEK